MTDRGAREALRAWGISADEIVRTPTGTMNLTYFVTGSQGQYVLRRHRTTDVSGLRWEAGVIEHVRNAAIPAPAIVSTCSGRTTLELDDGLWTLFERAEGTHASRHRMTDDQARAMGAMLADVHTALKTLDAWPSAYERRPGTDASARAIALLAAIDESGDDGSAASAARRWLRGYLGWHSPRRDVRPPPRREPQVIHGDFQDTNVLFAGDAVTAVIDWERAQQRTRAEEVVRALHLSFDLLPSSCASFVAGYRERSYLSTAELDAGAVAYGYDRDRSTWLLEELYVRHNERVRGLVEAMTDFVPFEERWDVLRSLLDGDA